MSPFHPSRLGPYEIVDEIGKGAMGVVYLARDPLIGRSVALKTFPRYLTRDAEREQFRARFIREAQSAGRLSHPNIVTLYNLVEEREDEPAFIAMEYVEGTNLKTFMQREHPQSLPFIVDVIVQVAHALDHAHSRSVIHRDIKPANILITSFDKRIKVADFGLARFGASHNVQQEGLLNSDLAPWSAYSDLTQEGDLLGTPNYMAPEQLLGRMVDHRVDLFALGVVLYEMVTQHKPFQGESLAVLGHRIVHEPYIPSSEYVQQLPPDLEGIIARALEKDPKRRYQTARDLAQDLRRLVGPVEPNETPETLIPIVAQEDMFDSRVAKPSTIFRSASKSTLTQRLVDHAKALLLRR